MSTCFIPIYDISLLSIDGFCNNVFLCFHFLCHNDFCYLSVRMFILYLINFQIFISVSPKTCGLPVNIYVILLPPGQKYIFYFVSGGFVKHDKYHGICLARVVAVIARSLTHTHNNKMHTISLSSNLFIFNYAPIAFSFASRLPTS